MLQYTDRPKQKIKTRAKMLERRMRGIEKTPYVAPYIHSLTITLEECHMGNWQPMANFIRVFQLLPNLRFLGMSHVPRAMVPTLESSFEGKLFPSVVALALPVNSAPILLCFPNVQSLTFDSVFRQHRLLDSIKGHCEHINTINNIYLSINAVDSLREAVPRVKRLSVWCNARPDTIRLLEGMDNLSYLNVRHLESPYTYMSSLDDIRAAAKQVLRTSNAHGPKELRIQQFTLPANIIEAETVYIIGGQ
ncbi:hypothetical protein C8R44DRAFT_875729 [Mycena epipterygia]|nr:hypothetical protein C8R44DRAFT_875729 [Mycena epipterygia]